MLVRSCKPVADAITIKGGLGSKDAVTVSYSDDAVANTGAFTMTGVETLNVTATNRFVCSADVLDLTNASGITTIQPETSNTNPNGVTINQMSGETVNPGGTGGTAVDTFASVTATLSIDATGASDAMTVNLADTNAAATTTTITANGIETMTLALANSTEDHKIALNNTNADNAASLVVTAQTPPLT